MKRAFGTHGTRRRITRYLGRMQKRAMCTLFAAVAWLATFAGSARSQETRSELHVRLEARPGAPLSGALVALLDGDRVVSEGLSTDRGTLTLGAAPGTYRLRVRRIGYRPYVSGPVALPFRSELLLEVESARVVLDAMIVSAHARCGPITRDAETLSAVWDEVAKALRSSQITLEDLSTIGRMKTFKRELGARGEVLSSDSAFVPLGGSRPFGTLDPSSLSRLGYVRGDPEHGWDYYGPDETVLLSDDFAATHCFRVVRDSRRRPGQIGVAFEPPRNRSAADIKGVFWVDERSAELLDIHFVYVNAGILSRFEPGGFAKFQRLPSGSLIVSEWQLRMPRLEVRRGAPDENIPVGYLENGGKITIVSPGDSSVRKR